MSSENVDQRLTTIATELRKIREALESIATNTR